MIAYMTLAGVLGIAAGGLGCLILRRPWGFKTAAIDAALAILVLIVVRFI